MDISEEIPNIATYIQGPQTDQKPPQFLSFDVVQDRMSSDPIDRSIRKHVTYATTNVLIYTSGTTGII